MNSPAVDALLTFPAERSWAKACGFATAACFCFSRVFRSRRLCCRWICNIEMADLRAIASGLSLSEIGTGGGWRIVFGGGAKPYPPVGCAGVAEEKTGVIGEKGGAVGELALWFWSSPGAGMVPVFG